MENSTYRRIIDNIEKNRQRILDAERHIWANPEIGYKEWKTTEYMAGIFTELGYTVTRPENITGFIADLDTGRPGPKVAIVAELDSLICAEHPECDPDTHAVHACGHHAQSAYLVGCAAAFAEPGALKDLCGSIRFISVPAEETIDLEFRNKLIEDGVIHYPAGKVEFLYRGLFDGVDIAMMNHVTPDDGNYLFDLHGGSDGCIVKHFEFKGRAAHAGVSPEDGINALYAATLGINACNALREKFTERDFIRFHPIITEAGYAANAIPEVAKLDAYTRASTFGKMKQVNEEVNRALCASAASIGADLLIKDNPGNMPLHNDKNLTDLCEDVISDLFGKEAIRYTDWITGSTDMGDISTLMPVVHPHTMGATGLPHGKDYQIVDPEKASVNAAKMLAGVAYRLLENDAALAKKTIREYRPVFAGREEYFKAIDAIRMNRTTVSYNDDGTVTLRYR